MSCIRILASGAAILFALLLRPTTAESWCLLPDTACSWCGMTWDNDQITNIPVYLNVNVAQHCDAFAGYFPGGTGGNSDCDDFQDIESTTRAALDELGDVMGSDVRFIYIGTTTAAPETFLSGAIHIFARETGSGFMSTSCQDNDADSLLESCWIATDLEHTYKTFQDQPPGNQPQPWHGLLLHELMHTLGFGHTNEPAQGCDQTQISVMDIGNRDKSHYFKDDILGVQAIYGTSTTLPRMKTSTDGSSWLNGPTSPSGVERVMPRYSVANNLQYAYSYGSFPRDYGGVTKRLRRMRSSGTTWEYLGQFGSTIKSFYHTGTTGNGFGTVNIYYQTGYDDDIGETDLTFIRSTDYGVTFGAATTYGVATNQPGVATTYDPEIGKTVIAWRQDGNADVPAEYPAHQVILNFEPGSLIADQLRFDGDPLWSADSPSIACGPASVVGTENCLLTWTTTTEWDRNFYWVQGHFETSGASYEFVFSDANVMVDPALVMGQANVAYTGNSTWPWIVTYHQGSFWVYTKRKSVSGDWTTLRTHYAYSYTTSPAVGSKWTFCWPTLLAPG